MVPDAFFKQAVDASSTERNFSVAVTMVSAKDLGLCGSEYPNTSAFSYASHPSTHLQSRKSGSSHKKFAHASHLGKTILLPSYAANDNRKAPVGGIMNGAFFCLFYGIHWNCRKGIFWEKKVATI